MKLLLIIIGIVFLGVSFLYISPMIGIDIGIEIPFQLPEIGLEIRGIPVAGIGFAFLGIIFLLMGTKSRRMHRMMY